jgi:hypothetical protein
MNRGNMYGRMFIAWQLGFCPSAVIWKRKRRYAGSLHSAVLILSFLRSE